jgi:hypothetical protein
MNADLLDELGTNPTQLLGLAAFASAALACVFANGKTPIENRVWIGLALANIAFFVELLFGIRHRLHEAAITFLRSASLYDGRTDLQYGLVFGCVALVLLVALSILLSNKLHRPGLIIATIASLSVVGLFAIEAISLHRIDQIFYERIGPVLLVGWLWSMACAITIVSTRF